MTTCTEKERRKGYFSNENTQDNACRLKRKHLENGKQQPVFDKDEDICFESKSTKKSRISWVSQKPGFEEEDKDLEEQIKILIRTKQL